VISAWTMYLVLRQQERTVAIAFVTTVSTLPFVCIFLCYGAVYIEVVKSLFHVLNYCIGHS